MLQRYFINYSMNKNNFYGVILLPGAHIVGAVMTKEHGERLI
jgi:hypothetical protein